MHGTSSNCVSHGRSLSDNEDNQSPATVECQTLKPAQLIRVANLDTAAEVWKRLADEYDKISELKGAQLNTKLRSIQKSPSISMQKHIDDFELLQREIEFHSTAMSAEDVNIAFQSPIS